MAPRINIPPATRVILVVIVALSFLYAVARFRQYADSTYQDPSVLKIPYLTLIPSVCIYYPWTFLTATFVEQNVVTLLVNGATMFLGGRYLERAWGSQAFVIVVLVATIIPNVLMVLIYIVWAAVTNNSLRAQTAICGGITIQATFLVAFKQLVPEHTVSIFKGMIKMRVKHFPAVFLLVNTLSGVLLGTDTALWMAWIGLVVSWIYLRFYKRQPSISSSITGGAGLKGDASETFAFATFFPDIIQPPIAAVCNQIFILLCSLRICTPFSDEAIATGNEQAAARSEGGLPSLLTHGRGLKGLSKREDAERRRALALRALDQRLNAASSRAANPPVTVTPSIPHDQQALGQTDYKLDEGH